MTTYLQELLQVTPPVIIKAEENKPLHSLQPQIDPPKPPYHCTSNLEVYMCTHCGMSSSFKVLLHVHILLVHKQSPEKHIQYEPHQCQNCPFTTFSLLLLFKHYRRHCIIHKCKECPFKTFNKPNLTYHIKKRHLSKLKKPITCPHCAYRAKSSQVLEAHVLSKHTSPENIQWVECDLCSYRGKHKEYLRKHMASMHRVVSADKWFECNQCLFRASSRYSLKSHKLEQHTLQNNYKCSMCAFSAKWKIHLKRHELEKHALPGEIKWFECEQCDFKAKRKSNLKQHVQARHAEVEEWFECEECGWKTKWKKNMKLHKERMKHVGENL
ncbi:hypothetical protein Zmor_026722 [Zophobas morio]|uniref:C2H2-type domain-containing protein n=1 Tax=Zophobas morio TaxID=2755281 RepID=A0AA38M5M9_9CUCU|nr:hypothetical protein Zmor_026722 [Zophobas morio]